MNPSRPAASRNVNQYASPAKSLRSTGQFGIKSPFTAALLGLSCLLFSFSAYSAPGDLDTRFGEDGIAITALGPKLDVGPQEFRAIIQDNNGNLVAAGRTHNGNSYDFAIARYTSAGVLDTTFGENGFATLGIGSNLDLAESVIEDSSGNLVIAGYTDTPDGQDIVLARFTQQGELDTRFGDKGVVVADINGNEDIATTVVEDSNGNLIVAGHSRQQTGYSNSWNFTLIRYTNTGDLDTSFGNNGTVLLETGSQDQAYSLTEDSYENLVIAGTRSGQLALARFSTTGAIDTAFGTNGITTTDINGNTSNANAVIEDRNGNLVVAGSHHNGNDRDYVLARYTSSGQLDTAFGTNGIVITDFDQDQDYAYALIEDSNGNLVAAGQSSIGGISKFSLARYTNTGTLDTSFAMAGVVTTDIGQASDRAYAMFAHSDGNLFLAGISDNNFAISSYTSTGALNTSFGSAGIVTNDLPQSRAVARSAIEDSNGKLVVAGQSQDENSQWRFTLSRFTAAGELDETFGNNGLVTSDFGPLNGSDHAYSVLEDRNGKLVVAGYGEGDFAVARYDSDGSLDTSFGTDGTVNTQIGSGSAVAYSVIEDSNGNLAVAGYSFNAGNTDFTLVRYTPSGDLDPSFGNGGIVITDFGGENDYARAVIEDSVGNLVVAGYSNNSNRGDFALARYNSAGNLDTGFGNGGRVTRGLSANTERAFALTEDSNSNLVIAGTYFDGGNLDIALLRFTSTGAPDQSFGNNGLVTTDIASESDSAFSVIEDESKNLVITGVSGDSGNNSLLVARYTNTGSPDPSFGGGNGIITVDAGQVSTGQSILQTRKGHYVTAGYTYGPENFMLTRILSGDEDSDNDGLKDKDDNCPLIANPDQLDSPDGDGIGNVCDPDRDNDGIDNDTEIANGTEPDNADSDDDGSDDNLDAFPNDPTETTDSDGDNVGDNTDAFADNPNASADTDGDGFPEDCSNDCGGLTPDPSPNDADNDGLVDSEDDVEGDNNPPEVTAPADIKLVASADLTTVVLGSASAYDFVDGDMATVTADTTDGQTSVELPPGRHTITWSATDEAGNTGSDTQTVDITPLASFSSPSQTAGDGSPVTLTVELNGDAVSYPVRIPLVIDESSTATGNDHDAVEHVIEILEDANPANTGTYEFVATDDGLTGEADETVIFNLVEENSLDVLENAALDDNAKQHTVTITELNVAPLISTVTLSDGTRETVLTGSEIEAHTVIRKDQDIALTAGLTDANPEDSHTYSWMINGELQAATGDTLMLNPMDYEPGEYTLSVQAVDDANPPEYSNTLEATLTLKNPAPAPAAAPSSSGGGGALHWLWLFAGLLLTPRLRSKHG